MKKSKVMSVVNILKLIIIIFSYDSNANVVAGNITVMGQDNYNQYFTTSQPTFQSTEPNYNFAPIKSIEEHFIVDNSPGDAVQNDYTLIVKELEHSK